MKMNTGSVKALNGLSCAGVALLMHLPQANAQELVVDDSINIQTAVEPYDMIRIVNGGNLTVSGDGGLKLGGDIQLGENSGDLGLNVFTLTGENAVLRGAAAGQNVNFVFGSGTGNAVRIEQGAVVEVGALAASGDTNFVFNNATLRATGSSSAFLDSSLGTIDIGASSLTFDTNTFDIGIGEGVLFTTAPNGKLEFVGNGSATINNAQNILGGTFVHNGTSLIIGDENAGDFEYVSDVTMYSNATLKGKATINGSIQNGGGVIAPGNSIGTLRLTGNYGGAGILQIEADGIAGTADKLIVGGDVDIQQTVLDLVLTPDTESNWPVNLMSPFIVIDKESAGRVTGDFQSVQDNLAFLDASVNYEAGDGNDVEVSLARNSTTPGNVTSDTQSVGVGEAAEKLGTGHAVHDAVMLLATDQVQAAYDSLGGEFNASARTAFLEDSRILRSAVWDRLYDADSGINGRSANTAYAEMGGVTLWQRAFGQLTTSSHDSAEMKRKTGGIVFGADKALWGSTRVGFMGAYSRSQMDVDSLNSKGKANNFSAGAYVGASRDQWSMRFGAAATWHQLDSKRSVVVGNTGFDELSSDQDAVSIQGFGEVAYHVNYGKWSFEPFANAAVVGLHSKAFEEEGSAAALQADAQVDTALFTTVGIRNAAYFNLGGHAVKLHGTVGWQFTPTDEVDFKQRFADGTDIFSVNGNPLAKNVGILEAGLDVQLGAASTLGLSYGGQLSADRQSHDLKAKLSFTF